METQFQHLSMTQCNDLTEIQRVVWWNTWHSENRSIRLLFKRGYEANMLANIPSTEGRWENVLKLGWKFSPIRSPRVRKWFIMGGPIFCTI